jgi:large conductance mechanosensitive channel
MSGALGSLLGAAVVLGAIVATGRASGGTSGTNEVGVVVRSSAHPATTPDHTTADATTADHSIGRVIVDDASGHRSTRRRTALWFNVDVVDRGGPAMRELVKEFKEFIATGNMIELAVAVILGFAVGRVITAFTDGVMMNLIAAIFGEPNFDEVRIKISSKDQVLDDGTVSNGTYLEIGTVITALVSLILTGLVLFFIIKAYNHMRKPVEPPPPSPTEVELLIQIRDALQAR